MTKSGQLWGGRFKEKPDETFAEFNDSFKYDRRLYVADVSASIAHANGLAKAGVITEEERKEMVDGLGHLLEQEALTDSFFDDSSAEDVHSFIEGKLIDLIGDTGRKL
ncbi:MAG TPA: lyase family protein, partial [Pyrinomonadaceae bacterium]|nr:lyase family protein [Pyrinomonadaceae bacterium]